MTPPPVEPGLAPMNISTMVITMPTSLRLVVSTVEKPAVRGVTAWNSAASSRSPAGMSAKAWSFSRKKNRAVDSTIRASVTLSTTLLCSL